MKKNLGEKEIIAEDLGFITPSVRRLVKRTGYPGMKILQFGFDAGGDSEHMPHNYEKNSIAYTGTHDNDTVLGFYRSMNKKDRKFCRQYLQLGKRIKGQELAWAFIRATLASVADTAIIPIQDYLALGNEGRINLPSTVGRNWKWQLSKTALTKDLAERILNITKTYRRYNTEVQSEQK
jgi:4-alpha-glucanotransferase